MAVVEADAEEPAGTQRIIGLNQLVAVAKRVFPRINEGGQPREPVRLDDGEQRKECGKHDGKQEHLFRVATADEEQRISHEAHDDRHGHVRLQHDESADDADDEKHRQHALCEALHDLVLL